MAYPKKWTIMFYFACDNEMSPLIVPQLRAIKDAGFHKDVDVVVHFDPNTPGASTRIYDVNRKAKDKPGSPRVRSGDGSDPFVHVVMEDYINWETIDVPKGSATADMRHGLTKPDSVGASSALKNFVGYCREQHQAEHYMLFLVGHGMVVGNDAFLPDEAPVSAITLVGLHQILKSFTKRVEEDGGTFELLALHSCSMSGIEVAYQLKGTANYMMSSEGTSYVGCWPYRQVLKRIFNSVGQHERALKSAKKASKAQDLNAAYPRNLIESLYYLTLCTTRDYLLGEYSLDLSLCSLAPDRVKRIKKPLEDLITVLIKGLKNDAQVKEHILLAHLESQSYWGEAYTDLFDFCRCLLAKRLGTNVSIALSSGSETEDEIAVKCLAVLNELSPSADKENPFDALIVHSDNYGWKFQYSHGLSIYFPWAPPLGDPNLCILGKYGEYAFNRQFRNDKSWLRFLETYWDTTMRRHREVEDARPESEEESKALVDRLNRLFDAYGIGEAQELRQSGRGTSVEYGSGGGKTSGEFGKTTGEFGKTTGEFGKTTGEFGMTAGEFGKTTGEFGKTTGEFTGGKTTPEQGAACSCPSIKNFPSLIVEIKGRLLRRKSAAATKAARTDIDMD